LKKSLAVRQSRDVYKIFVNKQLNKYSMSIIVINLLLNYKGKSKIVRSKLINKIKVR